MTKLHCLMPQKRVSPSVRLLRAAHGDLASWPGMVGYASCAMAEVVPAFVMLRLPGPFSVLLKVWWVALTQLVKT